MTDSREADGIERYVEAVQKGRRPPRFVPAEEDQGALQVAAQLAAARPGTDAPSERFASHLQQRLAGIADDRPGVPVLSRRSLVRRLAVPASAAVLGAAAASVARPLAERLLPAGADVPGELVPEANGYWASVAPLSSLSAERPLPFTAGAIQGYLVRRGDNVIALSAICTHLGCLLRSGEQSDTLDCPCHGASFTLDGAPLNPEYTGPLPRVRTRIVDGTIQVFTV